MAVGCKLLEICVGSIKGLDYPGQHVISVTFEKKFSAVPIVNLCVVGDNKESLAENVTTSGFDIIISDTGHTLLNNFRIDFHAFNVIR